MPDVAGLVKADLWRPRAMDVMEPDPT
jgi:hypothetical protein